MVSEDHEDIPRSIAKLQSRVRGMGLDLAAAEALLRALNSVSERGPRDLVALNLGERRGPAAPCLTGLAVTRRDSVAPTDGAVLLRYLLDRDSQGTVSGVDVGAALRKAGPWAGRALVGDEYDAVAVCASQGGSRFTDPDSVGWAIDQLHRRFPDQPITVSSSRAGLADVYRAIGLRYRCSVRVVVAESGRSEKPASRVGYDGVPDSPRLSSDVSLLSAPSDWPRDPEQCAQVARHERDASRLRERVRNAAGRSSKQQAALADDRSGPRDNRSNRRRLEALATLAVAESEAGRIFTSDGSDVGTRVVLDTVLDKDTVTADYLVLTGEPVPAESGLVVLQATGRPYPGAPEADDRLFLSPSPTSPDETTLYSVGMSPFFSPESGLGVAVVDFMTSQYPTARLEVRGPGENWITERLRSQLGDRVVAGAGTATASPEPTPATARGPVAAARRRLRRRGLGGRGSQPPR